jgi:chitinase
MYGAVSSDLHAMFPMVWLTRVCRNDVTASSTPGPNAPLSDGCGNSTQPLASAESAIRSWTNAGFPARQIVMGIPAYGYVSRSSVNQLATRSDNSTNPSASEYGNAVEIVSDDGGGDGGQIQFAELVRQGALVRNSGGDYDGAGGFERRWDSCSSTVSTILVHQFNCYQFWHDIDWTLLQPWLRSAARQQVISYDDPQSMRLKGELCRRSDILGVNMFAANGDDGWALIDGARRGLGVLL